MNYKDFTPENVKEKTVHLERFFKDLVRVTGLEPVRRKTHAPQTCLSAYSSTLAFILLFVNLSTQRVLLYHSYFELSILF